MNRTIIRLPQERDLRWDDSKKKWVLPHVIRDQNGEAQPVTIAFKNASIACAYIQLLNNMETNNVKN